MTQVVTRKKEEQAEQHRVGGRASSKRSIALVAVAAVVVGAVIGFAIFSTGGSSLDELQQIEQARAEAIVEYYENQWAGRQARIQQIRAEAMVDYYTQQWNASHK